MTNIATNFPPQTYSSSFFLNALTDEGVPASSRKKRSRSTDHADSSSAVLDCFISTMRSITTNIYTHVLSILLLNLTLCSGTAYDCLDAYSPKVRTFNSIIEYHNNHLSFNSQYNYVEFNVTSMFRLDKNFFRTYESNYIRKLTLTDKEINVIDDGAFLELYCVKYLSLQNNRISEIRNGTFEGLSSLEELSLRGNQIKVVPSWTFWKFRHLLKLDLSRNSIARMEKQTFDTLTSLWELNLRSNEIIDLPDEMFQNATKLHKLDLSDNKISVPTEPDFRFLQFLDILDLSNNGVYYIPDTIFLELKRLTKLVLSKNNLTHLNVTVLPILQTIYLDENRWQCNDLQKILVKLEARKIGVVVNGNILFHNINATDVGCYNGNTPIIPTTTTVSTTTIAVSTTTTPQYFPSIEPDVPTSPNEIPARDELYDKFDSLQDAVSGLKTVVIVFIILIVVFYVGDITIRTNFCARLRRRSHAEFPGNSGDIAFPLLGR